MAKLARKPGRPKGVFDNEQLQYRVLPSVRPVMELMGTVTQRVYDSSVINPGTLIALAILLLAERTCTLEQLLPEEVSLIQVYSGRLGNDLAAVWEPLGGVPPEFK